MRRPSDIDLTNVGQNTVDFAALDNQLDSLVGSVTTTNSGTYEYQYSDESRRLVSLYEDMLRYADQYGLSWGRNGRSEPEKKRKYPDYKELDKKFFKIRNEENPNSITRQPKTTAETEICEEGSVCPDLRPSE